MFILGNKKLRATISWKIEKLKSWIVTSLLLLYIYLVRLTFWVRLSYIMGEVIFHFTSCHIWNLHVILWSPNLLLQTIKMLTIFTYVPTNGCTDIQTDKPLYQLGSKLKIIIVGFGSFAHKMLSLALQYRYYN